ncbi:hypothetical protein LV507_14810 [Xanthomonas translucens]|uniref:hypothetical protein n=1 Tax=Xanthomonas campestris pv. translucens TaxID=343 RepID=UPI001F302DFE|nr:hypothetical protein [Xanthomonas translucens]UII63210.1 hypothetical protein LV507_14810 [Xanthomonas translucens]
MQEFRLGASLLQGMRRPSIQRTAVFAQHRGARIDDDLQQPLAVTQPLLALIVHRAYRAHVPVAQRATPAGGIAKPRNALEARARRAAQAFGFALRVVHQGLRLVVRALGVFQQSLPVLVLGAVQLEHRGQFLTPHNVVVYHDVAFCTQPHHAAFSHLVFSCVQRRHWAMKSRLPPSPGNAASPGSRPALAAASAGLDPGDAALPGDGGSRDFIAQWRLCTQENTRWERTRHDAVAYRKPRRDRRRHCAA